MSVFKKIRQIKTLFQIFNEALRATKPKPNYELLKIICQNDPNNTSPYVKFVEFIERSKSRSRIKSTSSWNFDESKEEWVLKFSNSLFADSKIRLYLPHECRKVIVMLPGSLTAASDVLENKKSTYYLKDICQVNNIGLAVWDWPLSGERLTNSIYRQFRSYVSAEKEYARILPYFGTCLWREYFEELDFCLKQVRQKIGFKLNLEVYGWSQGGHFAYFSPFCKARVSKVVAAGSCAEFEDLIAQGKGHFHGYFFYPLMNSCRFSLLSVVKEIIHNKIPLLILFGDKDRGCLDTTVERLRSSLRNDPDHEYLNFSIIPGVSHEYSGPIEKSLIKEILR